MAFPLSGDGDYHLLSALADRNGSVYQPGLTRPSACYLDLFAVERALYELQSAVLLDAPLKLEAGALQTAFNNRRIAFEAMSGIPKVDFINTQPQGTDPDKLRLRA